MLNEVKHLADVSANTAKEYVITLGKAARRDVMLNEVKHLADVSANTAKNPFRHHSGITAIDSAV
jgi:hypothetical protein